MSSSTSPVIISTSSTLKTDATIRVTQPHTPVEGQSVITAAPDFSKVNEALALQEQQKQFILWGGEPNSSFPTAVSSEHGEPTPDLPNT